MVSGGQLVPPGAALAPFWVSIWSLGGPLWIPLDPLIAFRDALGGVWEPVMKGWREGRITGGSDLEPK